MQPITNWEWKRIVSKWPVKQQAFNQLRHLILAVVVVVVFPGFIAIEPCPRCLSSSNYYARPVTFAVISTLARLCAARPHVRWPNLRSLFGIKTAPSLSGRSLLLSLTSKSCCFISRLLFGTSKVRYICNLSSPCWTRNSTVDEYKDEISIWY